MTGLNYGYGTNGFANHTLTDTISILADLGYRGIALTLDHHHLNPYDQDLPKKLSRVANQLDRHDMAVIIETGARYLLDPWHKHEPTLVSANQEPRIDYLTRAIHIAADLGAQAMSFWSGVPRDVQDDEAWTRLLTGCDKIATAADHHGVRLGFEPEPGMLIDTIDRYEELAKHLGDPAVLGITLDIGHCQCLEPQPIPDCVRRVASRLVNVQIDDMRTGIHEHLEFGTGDIDFPPVLAALKAVNYRSLVAVELPRHSHAAPETARNSLEFLTHEDSR